MATERRTRRYETYGSSAYQPDYQYGSAAPARRSREAERTRRSAQPQRVSRPKVQPRTRVAARPSVEVRQQSAVSPFAILGFAAVALIALLVVMTSARLAMVNDETVDLKSTLSQLQSEEKILQAQYELAYDLSAIESQLTADGSMVKAGAANTVYLDLSEGDSVTYFEASERGLSGLLRQAEQFLSGLLS